HELYTGEKQVNVGERVRKLFRDETGIAVEDNAAFKKEQKGHADPFLTSTSTSLAFRVREHLRLRWRLDEPEFFPDESTARNRPFYHEQNYHKMYLRKFPNPLLPKFAREWLELRLARWYYPQIMERPPWTAGVATPDEIVGGESEHQAHDPGSVISSDSPRSTYASSKSSITHAFNRNSSLGQVQYLTAQRAG
ncbi:unnamed protein product, partial [Amoebophrya sp. A120]